MSFKKVQEGSKWSGCFIFGLFLVIVKVGQIWGAKCTLQ